MEKVSIIVPFYNVESYIGDCLKSLVHQSYGNIEILCIDDDSPDGSLSIVEEFAKLDSRIKIIKHKKNKGLGGARNSGIHNATGEYICFVDSDDYVSNQFVESLYRSAKNNDSELVICNILFDVDGEIKPFYKNYCNETFKNAASKGKVFDIVGQINPACWNKIYKKKLLLDNKIFQPEHRYYEGVLFWIKSIYYSSTIATIPDKLYYYRLRPNSIMTSHSTKHIDDRFDFIQQIDSFVKNTMLQSQYANTNKITDDTMAYYLNQLSYGKKLLSESDIENKKHLEEYYKQKVSDLSMENNWPGLTIALELYEANNALRKKARDQNATIQKLRDKMSSNSG